MKKTSLILFVLSIITTTYAQEIRFSAPDYEKIKKEIIDTVSPNYYPNLLSRLEQFDTTLTVENYRTLYYGYVFNEKYEPYWNSPYQKELLNYYNSEKINPSDYAKIIELTSKSIQEFPFDLRQLNFMAYTQHLQGNEEGAYKTIRRLNRTLEAIISSGDGKSCETAFHVISVSHEYVLISVWQFRSVSQALIDKCDYLSLETNSSGISGIYFNVEKLFEHNPFNKKD